MKAVITAAGRGTRLFPMTKEMPKEMMPIFSRINGKKQVLPLLQLIFEQLYSCGTRNYCFVVGREKRSIKDHFTLEQNFLKKATDKDISLFENFYEKIANSKILWANQNQPKGFGDAVKHAEKFVGGESFVVHAGDVSVLTKSKHPIMRLRKIGASDSKISAVLLFRKVHDPERHGVPTLEKISTDKYRVNKVVEKPKHPKSKLGLLPLYYFSPTIFQILKKLKPGINNEYQLTDAIQDLIEKGHQVLAIPLEKSEKILDVGTVDSFWLAQKDSFKYA